MPGALECSSGTLGIQFHLQFVLLKPQFSRSTRSHALLKLVFKTARPFRPLIHQYSQACFVLRQQKKKPSKRNLSKTAQL